MFFPACALTLGSRLPCLAPQAVALVEELTPLLEELREGGLVANMEALTQAAADAAADVQVGTIGAQPFMHAAIGLHHRRGKLYTLQYRRSRAWTAMRAWHSYHYAHRGDWDVTLLLFVRIRHLLDIRTLWDSCLYLDDCEPVPWNVHLSLGWPFAGCCAEVDLLGWTVFVKVALVLSQ